jgi:guanylate kinase
MSEDNKHLIVIIVGGTGTGKTTVADDLAEQGYFEKAVTCTTRIPRVGEKNFLHYVFLDSKKELDDMYSKNELIETPSEFAGNWYGCPKKSVYKNNPVLVVMEYAGLKKAQEVLGKDSSVIVAPVFLEPWKEKDIIEGFKKRGSTEKEIGERLAVRKIESSWGDDDTYVLKIKTDFTLSKEDSVRKTTDKIANLIKIYKPKYESKTKLSSKNK